MISDSYQFIQQKLRKKLGNSQMSYRDLANAIHTNHTQLWSFHKKGKNLDLDTTERLATVLNVKYEIVGSANSDMPVCSNIKDLEAKIRLSLNEAIESGISYRKLSKNTGISYEWIRCFHIKDAEISSVKIFALADFLGINYKICSGENAQILEKPNKKTSAA